MSVINAKAFTSSEILFESLVRNLSAINCTPADRGGRIITYHEAWNWAVMFGMGHKIADKWTPKIMECLAQPVKQVNHG